MLQKILPLADNGNLFWVPLHSSLDLGDHIMLQHMTGGYDVLEMLLNVVTTLG